MCSIVVGAPASTVRRRCRRRCRRTARAAIQLNGNGAHPPFARATARRYTSSSPPAPPRFPVSALSCFPASFFVYVRLCRFFPVRSFPGGRAHHGWGRPGLHPSVARKVRVHYHRRQAPSGGECGREGEENRRTDARTAGCADRWTHSPKDEPTDGRTDRRTDARTGGPKDGGTGRRSCSFLKKWFAFITHTVHALTHKTPTHTYTSD